MNIFVLDLDPIKAAEYHVDKHTVKMIVESIQMLCAVHHKLGSSEDGYYKLTHKNHPCTKWCSESLDNYNWTIKLTEALLSEYTKRYGKIHKSTTVLNKLKLNIPKLSAIGLTDFAQAMPDEYRCNNAVDAYRLYYMKEKRHIAKWKTNIPYWWI